MLKNFPLIESDEVFEQKMERGYADALAGRAADPIQHSNVFGGVAVIIAHEGAGTHGVGTDHRN